MKNCILSLSIVTVLQNVTKESYTKDQYTYLKLLLVNEKNANNIVKLVSRHKNLCLHKGVGGI